jgi:shikimate kinase
VTAPDSPRAATAPIFLLGMMGAGKSTVGPLLARSRGAVFIELDRRIELLFGAAIAQLFARGEAFFRSCERVALRSLVDEPGFAQASVVVATGGGIVCDPENLRTMSSVGRLVYLEVDVATLCERLLCTPAQRNARPLLGPEANLAARVSELLAMREASYRQATLIIDGRGSPEQVAARVLQQI